MYWLTEDEIKNHLSNVQLDIRITGNGRWIDQKCTPDVLCIVADCIINHVNSGNSIFTSVDVWHDEYTKSNVQQIFCKPDLTSPFSRHEYDKFFQQPMELLSYAKILIKQKKGNRNFYSIGNKDLLSYISFKERNALTFLQIYIEEVLKASGMFDYFESFFQEQTPQSFKKVKQAFEDFTIKYTPINGKTECRRIFSKVINPLAFKYKSVGTKGGYISRNPITYDMLMYNRDNFRDVYSEKPKGVTRSEYEEKIKLKPNINYTRYMIDRAKRILKEYNDRFRNGISEVLDGNYTDGPALHVHHIFPESRFPQIAAYIENLISLTPSQHYICAHPNGNTQDIDLNYQHICLLAKTKNIEDNLKGDPKYIIYEFDKFVYVLNTGFNTNDFSDVETMDFQGIITKINLKYA